MEDGTSCALCGRQAPAAELAEAAWTDPATVDRLAREHPGWRRSDGACPACVQEALLELLRERGDAALHEAVQAAWPLDAQAAFGALPTPLRLHADPRFQGRGVTIALVDAAFHPHPDLVSPVNRIRAWADASRNPVEALAFGPDDPPRWPGWDDGAPLRWHGLMTSCAAAGNGRLSHGLYRGPASEASLVLVQVAGEDGRIADDAIVRALRWLRDAGPALGVRVVSLSVAGTAMAPGRAGAIDLAVRELVEAGVTVVAAAGNDGVRRLVPPATAPEALTVGGIDDTNTFDHAQVALWHGNYGAAADGSAKPELVAPSIWVVAPILPGTGPAWEAATLFARRAAGDAAAEGPIQSAKLVTPHYQHVEGTSFAAPLVAATVACMLEASPGLTPALVRDALTGSARPVPGASPERQGAGVLDAGEAVARALHEPHGPLLDDVAARWRDGGAGEILFHDHRAREVRLVGSWDDWSQPGIAMRLVEPGLFRAAVPAPGRHTYKLLLDGTRWVADPLNPHREPDGHGGENSVLPG